eukprot:456457-Ditylum_brightwellii.AAC.1
MLTYNRHCIPQVLLFENHQEFYNSLPDHVKWTLGTLKGKHVDAEYWLDALNNSLVTIATDGPVKDSTGCYAVIFWMRTCKLCLQGPFNSHATQVSSCRIELSGILAVYYWIQSFITFTETPVQQQLTVLCNNIFVVRATNSHQWPGVLSHIA